MDMSTQTIEKITGMQLRKLALWPEPKEEKNEDEDIYVEECILDLEDNDALSIAEGGFMMGYLDS